ncbi:MAG: hypothetical protein K0M50_02930 [Prolixibacteraceae bacterium]|nr:hypothetical protein [Prolixibacteraceae bacterium]
MFGFNQNIICRFENNISEANGEIVFTIPESNTIEKMSCLGDITLPQDSFFQLNPDKSLINKAFVFSSVFELIAFYQLFKPQNSLLYAIGSRPSVITVKRMTQNRFILALGNSLQGRLSDIRLACLISKNIEPLFKIENDIIYVKAEKYQAQADQDRITLSAFNKQSRFRANLIKTIKPPPTVNSFVELLIKTTNPNFKPLII